MGSKTIKQEAACRVTIPLLLLIYGAFVYKGLVYFLKAELNTKCFLAIIIIKNLEIDKMTSVDYSQS